MLYLLLSLVGITLLVALFAWISSRRGNDSPVVNLSSSCDSCTGENEKCEQVCMMEAATKDIEYYNDEELDAYAGRPSDSYTDEEVEEFAEVLHTMRVEEVAGWCRSLTLRDISLPDVLKDEVLMMREG